MPAQKSDQKYSISKLAQELQVSEHVIRRWEKTYKIASQRNERGHRFYTETDLKKFQKVQAKLNSKENIVNKIAHTKAKKAIKDYSKTNKRIAYGTLLSAAVLFLLALQFNSPFRNKLQPLVLSYMQEKAETTFEPQRVLGARDRVAEFVFNVNVPTNLGADVTIEGDLFVPTVSVETLNDVTSINATTQTTLEETLALGGDFTGTLNNVTIAPGTIQGTDLSSDLTYTGTLNVEGVFQAAGDEGSDGQILTSTGDGVEWTDIDVDNADTLDDIDSTAFLRSNTSDSYTSGTLAFSDGTFLDLSSVTHNDSASQGLRLPQAASLTIPATGEGFLAYDTAADQVQVFNGTSWSSISGASTSLQQAYTAGNTIELSAGEGDLQITNDGSTQILFLDEDTGRVGIGDITPSYKLDVAGDLQVAAGSDIYLESEALRGTVLGNRTYTEGNYVSDSQSFTASIDAMDAILNDLAVGDTGMWREAGNVGYLFPTTLDFAIGGTTLAASIFSIDEDTGIFLFGGDQSINPTLTFEATDSSSGNFGFNDNDAFYIANANLGIGTTNPSYELEVNGELNTTTLYIGGAQVTSTPAEINILDGATVSTTELNYIDGTTVTNGGLVFGNGTYLTEDAVNLFWNNTTDRLGIGTTEPSYTLDVNGTVRVATGSDITLEGETLRATQLGARTYSEGNYVTNLQTLTASIDSLDTQLADVIGGESGLWIDEGSYIHPSTSSAFNIMDTGLIGIGTTAPSEELEVQGVVYLGDVSAPTPTTNRLYSLSGSLYWDGTDLSAGGGGSSEWTLAGGAVYPNLASTDVVVGGTSLASSIFSIDENAGVFLFAGDQSANPILRFEATDSDTADFGFTPDDTFYISGASLGIGTTNPTSTLEVIGTFTASTSVSTPLISLSGTGTLNGLDAVDSTGENTIEALIFDADAENISGVWEVQDNVTFQFGNEGDFRIQYDETTDDQLKLSDGTNNFLTVADQGSSADFAFNGNDLYVDDGGNVGIGNSSPSEALHVSGDVRIQGGELYLDPLSTSSSTTEGTIYYDSDVDHLFLYTGDSSFHRIALDMTQYTATDTTVPNQGYIQIAHSQGTNDLSITGWFYDTITSLWKNVTDRLTKSVDHDLAEEFNPEYTAKKKVSTVTLHKEENTLGDGADGAVTVSSDTDITATDLIGGRSCPDGGDAVNYNVSSFTDQDTLVLSSTPSSGCLAAGDEVLLINLQGSTTAYGNVGNFETLEIESVSSNTINFTNEKTKYYGDGTDSDDTNLGTTAGTQRVMMQRVPNYTTLTVNTGINFYPDDWDTAKGGVMFFRATGAVAVNGTGNIHADGKGYRGGLDGASYDGGQGGGAFCGGRGVAGGTGGDGDNATSSERDGEDGSCGGGGGAGADDDQINTGGSGSASLGGAGGGGGGSRDNDAGNEGYAAGGAGGGYGTAGGYGNGLNDGTNGGTNTSGNGGNSATSTHSYAGGGGGGGTYGDTNLTDLYMGAGGGAGGDGEINDTIPYNGGHGGDGGGIVYIAADSITVSGTLSSDGADGEDSEEARAGGGGGGAGGSVKLLGNTVTLGTSLVTTAAGSGATATSTYDGGDGGTGRIAIGYGTSISGTTSPTYNSIDLEYNPYAVYVSEEIETPGATAFNDISWTEDLDTNGEIQFQTRSGNTADSTDGSWASWAPVSSSTTLETANTHGNWSGTNATVAEGDVARNVDYFEDEDENNSSNITKITATANGGFAEATISSADISSRDYVVMWIRSSVTGDEVTLGIGEAAATEQTQDVYIDQANAWQKVYWDISDITGTSRDGITELRVTVNTSGAVVYIDNMTADSYLTTSGGSTITSAVNNYIQYRAIFSTTNSANKPDLSKVVINMTNSSGTYDLDADDIIDPNKKVDTDTARPIDPKKLDFVLYDTGNGADGAITVSSNTDITATSLISGRSCADGGDAVNYSVSSVTDSDTVVLSSTPSSGCLSVGDEVLLINQQGTTSAYGNVGNWETLRVSNVSGTTVDFTTNKSKYYGDGTDSDDTNIGTGSSNQRVMLQRVPNYTTVTVNTVTNFYPDDWDGTKGGVIFFRATGAVAINGSGSITADSRGYLGGLDGAAYDGGAGGGAFCGGQGVAGGTGGDGDNATSSERDGEDGSCGGGGGAGADDDQINTGGSGSASLGGAGGGGGGSRDNDTGNEGYAGGGAGGGYGAAGSAGGGLSGTATAGGTNTSGDGGNSTTSTHSYAGGGGGGGTYGDANLTDLYMGSGGGAGGDGEINDTIPYDGGHGGDGGGIVYIAADSVTVSGTISSDGADGTASAEARGGGGGGGAGGSVKLVANDLTLGASIVSADPGAGSTTPSSYDGGSGGSGRIALYYDNSVSGTTSPSYTVDTNSEEYNEYEVVISNEIATSGATSFTDVEWTEDLDTNGEIQFQTRSGNTTDSTDGTWESWAPTSSSTTLSNGDTHTEWAGTNITVADGDVTRNIEYYEDEDESTSGNLTKFTNTAANGYAEDTISSTDISSYDYLTLWVRTDAAGSTVTLGFGEAAATEQTETFYIEEADIWQKIYWDISDVTGTARDGVTALRVTISENSAVSYIDEIKAESYLSTNTGSSITSTANNYIQYRAILTTTNILNSPTLSEVRINYSDGSSQTVNDRLANQNDIDNFDNGLRLSIATIDLDDYKSINIDKNASDITATAEFDFGDGADGDVTISSDADITVTSNISGRSCTDGGDAPNYSVTALTSRTATITQAPSTGCLTVGDEILLINLQGSTTSYGNVGNYETLRIESISGNTITFSSTKENYYGDNADDDTNIGTAAGTQRVMLQRVPNYQNLTVNSGINFYPDDWDRTKGGVMFFRANGHVAINGTLHSEGRGYVGGIDGAAYDGGQGGGAFCGTRGTAGGTGGDGDGAGGVGENGACGGGGGAGGDDNVIASGGSGSESLGGGGGGGGGSRDITSNVEGYGGGGAGGGYGTAGSGGGGLNSGENGFTKKSGDGASSGSSTNSYGGGGGGGGTYGDTSLISLMMGSGGGAGGDGEVNDSNPLYDGGHGGDGGGIVYIAANSITVSGTLQSDGEDGDEAGGSQAGGGGGGAGGAIKVIAKKVVLGNTHNDGTYQTRAEGGDGAATTSTYDGGDAGDGRIAILYGESYSGSPNPTEQNAETSTTSYAVFVSDEINTPDAVSYNNITWDADEGQYGTVQLQTRSGASSNSTDNTWEAWRPVTSGTNYLELENANTHGDWTASGSTLTIADGDITRDVNYFEDEDETTSGNLTKLTVGANANTYAETHTSEKDMSDYDFVTFWAYSSTGGNKIKLGFGETVSTEHEALFKFDSANTWQKFYWDIRHIPDHEKDAVKNFRVIAPDTSYTLYFDNIEAERLLNTPGGSDVSSTPNEYVQYRVVMTSSEPTKFPVLYNVQVEWGNGFKIEQTDTNNVRLYNYTGETQQLRLDAVVFGADLAEWYTVDDETIGPGDLVALTGKLDEQGVPILTRTDQMSDPDLIGGISTKAGKELGIEAENRRLLALAGRIPVRVDETSGPIKAGDSITSGPGKGTAKKAEVGERAIGRALEDWDPVNDGESILILVAPGYTHGTEIVATRVGDLEEKVSSISQLLGLEGTDGSADAVLSGLTETATEMASTFSEFQTYVDGLGITMTENALSEAMLAINSDFAVTGETSLGGTTITGDLNVGQFQIDPLTNSLNVLGAACVNEDIGAHNEALCDAQTIYIQKTLSGNIDLFDGAVLIEPNGNITLRGIVDAEVIIADEYVVKSAAQTTGSASIQSGGTETVIETDAVENTSKIFVTPTSKTEGQSLYIKGKIDGVSFTVAIDESVFEDIDFDWWVLNVQE